eukprot:PLAT3585.2.p1 GENE.PLAT3585.2~~PLAT3585.2.p1  ORF type:complete len:400 (-),score=53.69 PLAT3585.2:117-1316(-)
MLPDSAPIKVEGGDSGGHTSIAVAPEGESGVNRLPDSVQRVLRGSFVWHDSPRARWTRTLQIISSIGLLSCAGTVFIMDYGPAFRYAFASLAVLCPVLMYTLRPMLESSALHFVLRSCWAKLEPARQSAVKRLARRARWLILIWQVLLVLINLSYLPLQNVTPVLLTVATLASFCQCAIFTVAVGLCALTWFVARVAGMVVEQMTERLRSGEMKEGQLLLRYNLLLDDARIISFTLGRPVAVVVLLLLAQVITRAVDIGIETVFRTETALTILTLLTLIFMLDVILRRLAVLSRTSLRLRAAVSAAYGGGLTLAAGGDDIELQAKQLMRKEGRLRSDLVPTRARVLLHAQPISSQAYLFILNNPIVLNMFGISLTPAFAARVVSALLSVAALALRTFLL